MLKHTCLDTPIAEDNFCAELLLLLKYMSPIDVDEFKEGSHLEKVIMIIKVNWIFYLQHKLFMFRFLV